MTTSTEHGSGRGARRRVLLVEDDLELRDALTDTLEETGHEVVAVPDGHEGLRVMRHWRPDIVVLDLMMPVMDGWQFRIEQRRDPALADIPVVAISASYSSTAAAVDADLYIQKPLDARTLLHAIEDVLQVRARRQEPARIAQTERMAALGQLAAGVAHEINNPLTYVLLHLTMATRLLPTLGTEQNRKQLDKIATLLSGALEGVERIRAITSGIRTFSRVDEVSRTEVDLGTVIDAALELVMNELRHRARLTRDYRDTPAVRANEGRLGQVFLNLLGNAIQALPDGPIEHNEIRVATHTSDSGDAVVEITDTGQGIPEHIRGRIFEPFFSTKPIGQGTGLGLSISHGIITSLGGEITVASEVGRGTTFRVILPPASRSREPAALGEEPGGPSTAATPAARRRLLVIDDEVSVCEAIRDALAGEHEVDIATSGTQALAILGRDTHYDVILCDLHMPGLTGMDIYERLHSAQPDVARKMIFMTAGTFTDRARAFEASSQRPFVSKPIDIAHLRAIVDTLPE